MPVTLVAIVASRVGIENTSSCSINRRSHAVAVKKSEFSCVFEQPVACRRASAWCRCRAREHNSLYTRSQTCTRQNTKHATTRGIVSCRAKQYNKINGVRLTSPGFLPRFSSSIRFSMAGRPVRSSVHRSLHLPASQQLVATLLSNPEYDGRTTVGHQSDRATTVPRSQPNGGSILAQALCSLHSTHRTGGAPTQ